MDQNLQDIADKIIKYLDQKNVQYSDVRADQQVKNSALIENNDIEHIKNNEDKTKTIQETDREKLDAKFTKKEKEKLN